MTATPTRRGLVGAAELAARLGQRHPPTPEQARAIEQLGTDGRLGPCLVVAGAGSGKTETMAARVVWLVANGLVRPERILGLSFTRKAAGELGDRVRTRLRALARSGLLAPVLIEESDGGFGADWLDGDPTVRTYNAYAAGVFAEHALRIGREPGARLLSEAMTWQYAGAVVRYDGDMSEVESAPVTVVGAVRALASDLDEHLATPDGLRRHVEQLTAAITAVPDAPGKRGLYAATSAVLEVQRRRLQLLPLVEAYAQRKRAAETVDYGDQVALAARLAREHPEVGAVERDRYDVVLLDEYQDTGTAQREMLRGLFGGGHPVMAVGDPCQSIYGWRGASAGNLRHFTTDFPDRSGGPGSRLDLTVSFRNGGRILAVANQLSMPLRAHGVPVQDLRPGPRGADSGDVHYALHPDALEEAAWTAERIAGLLQPGADGRPPERAPGDIAVLCRARSQFDRIERALRERGVPVEVSGLGGLLTRPEVADVVATLWTMSDPYAGPAVLRLLTGPRWRLGPRDLDALGRRARALAAPATGDGGGGSAGTVGTGSGADAALDRAETRSLVEAVDDPGAPTAYSMAGWQRIDALRHELRSLRRRSDQPLGDLVADVIRTLHLDVEVASRPGADPAAARVHLDRFLDVAAEFAEGEDSPSLDTFLAFLDAAAEYERGLEAGRVRDNDDAVTLLTMHGAKGLEWPVVFVPGMVGDVFPSKMQQSSDWCRNVAALPAPLRGDAADLPVLEVAACADQKELKGAIDAHYDAYRARHELEERRLLYVAATRAQELLVCSGYWWDHARSPRRLSPFLVEVRDVCAALRIGREVVWAPEPEPGAVNPVAGAPSELRWPHDPLTPADREGLDHGARLARAAALAGSPPPDEALDASPSPDEALAASPSPDEALAASPSPDEALDASLPPDGGRRTGGGGQRAAGSRAVAQLSLFDPQAEPSGTPTPPPHAADRAGAWREEVDRLLDERRRLAATHGHGQPGTGDEHVIEVPLPAHLSVSQLVALRRDPAALARWLRRPVPLAPAPLARRGTAFHAWLEQRFAGERLLDIDELPGAEDAGAGLDSDLAALKEHFLTSAWAARQPAPGGIEVPFEMSVEGVVVRGRMDAVFTAPDGGWQVVDWKTGARPHGAEAAAVAVQLAAYRLAWHRLSGAPLAAVSASFHYVRSGETVSPVDLLDEDGLAALVTRLPEQSPG